MADNNFLKTLKFGDKSYPILPPWEYFNMTQNYMATLLSRDEYTPVLKKQPASTDTTYTDPGSGNLAGFHAGQCVIYPDAEVEDGWGLSIAKQVTINDQGVPTKVFWYHATDVEKRVRNLEETYLQTHKGVFGTGVWINEYLWQADAVWDNGN